LARLGLPVSGAVMALFKGLSLALAMLLILSLTMAQVQAAAAGQVATNGQADTLSTSFPSQPASSSTNSPMVYIHNAPESDLDRRYDYQWEILATALEKTRPKYGDYLLQPSQFVMTERRQASELMRASKKLTVMYLGTTAEFERELIPVRIPVDKNLAGYMVYLIRGEDQPLFSAVHSLDDLRRFTIGQGQGWLDVGILEAGGFKVVTGAKYDNLFSMLLNKRFDAFQRSVVEVLEEYDQRHEAMPDLHIEEQLLFYYPLPMYFWFSRTEAGQRLAERAREGMLMMLQDGSFNAIFTKYFQSKIDRLHLKQRRLLRIDNPLLGPETPFDDHRLWYNPLE